MNTWNRLSSDFFKLGIRFWGIFLSTGLRNLWLECSQLAIFPVLLVTAARDYKIRDVKHQVHAVVPKLTGVMTPLQPTHPSSTKHCHLDCSRFHVSQSRYPGESAGRTTWDILWCPCECAMVPHRTAMNTFGTSLAHGWKATFSVVGFVGCVQ